MHLYLHLLRNTDYDIICLFYSVMLNFELKRQNRMIVEENIKFELFFHQNEDSVNPNQNNTTNNQLVLAKQTSQRNKKKNTKNELEKHFHIKRRFKRNKLAKKQMKEGKYSLNKFQRI
jgi:hypothetical protein